MSKGVKMRPSRRSAVSWAMLALALFLAPAAAQSPQPKEAQAGAAGREAVARDAASAGLPADSASRRTALIGAERLSYTATAGSLPLYGGKGETTAKVFYVSYMRDGPASGR